MGSVESPVDVIEARKRDLELLIESKYREIAVLQGELDHLIRELGTTLVQLWNAEKPMGMR